MSSQIFYLWLSIWLISYIDLNGVNSQPNVIPINEVNFKYFNIYESDRFELNLLNSTRRTKHIFKECGIIIGGRLVVEIIKILPVIGQLAVFLPTLIQNLLDNQSEWKNAFAKTIAIEMDRAIAVEKLHTMESAMRTLQSKISLLNETNPNQENRRTIASIFHTEQK